MIGTIAQILLLGQIIVAHPDCGAKQYRGIIAKTEALVLKRAEPQLTSESLRGSNKACVRLEFSISNKGRATDIRIVETSGYRALDVAAIKALEEYCFRPQKRNVKDYFMLIFRPHKEDGL